MCIYANTHMYMKDLHLIPVKIVWSRSSLPTAFVQFDLASCSSEKKTSSSFLANVPAS